MNLFDKIPPECLLAAYLFWEAADSNMLMPNHFNPFNPGAGRDPPYLAGREEEIDRFSLVLRDLGTGRAENVLIHGPRGTGKTVLLHKLVQLCMDEDFLPVARFQYNEKHSKPKTFFTTLQHDVDKVIETFSKMEKAKKKIQTFADYIKPTNVGILGAVSYEPSYALNTNTSLEDQIVEYLMQKWNLIQKKGYKGVVFLLDEFHMVRDTKQNDWHVLADFIGAINDVQSRGCMYSFILCGLPILPINIKIARSYSERMFTSFNITNLNHDSSRMAITEPLKKTDWRFSDELVDSIIRDTGGYPYFIQFFCREIINRMDKSDVGLGDYERIKDMIKDNLSRDFFDRRIETLSDGQIKALQVMASMPEKKVTFTSIQKSSDITKGPLSNHLRRLEEKGLIYRAKRGIYQFPIPLFQEYLLRKNHI